MPKSSIATLTPMRRSCSSAFTTLVQVARQHALGDLELEQPAGSPDSASAARTVSTTAPWRNWRADRLTATWMRPSPAAAQPAASRQALRSAHSPIGTIRPLSSASGMNCAGDTRPRPGRSQRISASQPRTSPVARSTCGC